MIRDFPGEATPFPVSEAPKTLTWHSLPPTSSAKVIFLGLWTVFSGEPPPSSANLCREIKLLMLRKCSPTVSKQSASISYMIYGRSTNHNFAETIAVPRHHGKKLSRRLLNLCRTLHRYSNLQQANIRRWELHIMLTFRAEAKFSDIRNVCLWHNTWCLSVCRGAGQLVNWAESVGTHQCAWFGHITSVNLQSKVMDHWTSQAQSVSIVRPHQPSLPFSKAKWSENATCVTKWKGQGKCDLHIQGWD